MIHYCNCQTCARRARLAQLERAGQRQTLQQIMERFGVSIATAKRDRKMVMAMKQENV